MKTIMLCGLRGRKGRDAYCPALRRSSLQAVDAIRSPTSSAGGDEENGSPTRCLTTASATGRS
jgi:hypothetical protein